MVGLGGLEPPTSPLSGARSSHLSYRPYGMPKYRRINNSHQSCRPYEIAVAIHCKRFILSMLPHFTVEYKLPF